MRASAREDSAYVRAPAASRTRGRRELSSSRIPDDLISSAFAARTRGVAAQHASLSRWRSPVRIRSGPPRFSHPSDAPFARPNGASLLAGAVPVAPYLRRTDGRWCVRASFSRDRVDRDAASARPAPAGRSRGALDGADLPRSSSSPTRRASASPAGSASTARASPTCSTPTASSCSSMRSPSGCPTAARWSSPRSSLRRHELALVRVGGPRGDRTRRVRTTTAPPRPALRPVHRRGPPAQLAGQDPLAALRARDPMVPLTDAVILFRVGPDIVEEPPARSSSTATSSSGCARASSTPAAWTCRRSEPFARDYDPRVPPTARRPIHGPLAGIRVIDCSTVLAGPFCTMLLGDLGADVIKVEPPEGDATRGWGPPWVGDAADGTRTAAYYLAVNRNKRSIRLDLAQRGRARGPPPRSCAAATPSSRTTGSAGFARLGFSDEVLARAQSRARPPGDQRLRHARAGRREARLRLRHPGGRRPDVDHRRAGRAADEGRGRDQRRRERAVRGGRACWRACSPRERAPARRSAGGGQRIDVSLLQSTLAVLVNQAQSALVTGVAPRAARQRPPEHRPVRDVRDGRRRDRGRRRERAPVGAARARDRAAGARHGRAIRHERRPGRAPRRAHPDPRRALRDRRPARPGWRAWTTAGIPAGPILDVPAAFASPQAAALGSRVPLEHPTLGRVDQVGIPFELAGTPATIRLPPPLLGEHTDEILREAGYDARRSTGCAPLASSARRPSAGTATTRSQRDHDHRERDADRGRRREVRAHLLEGSGPRDVREPDRQQAGERR